MKSTDLALLPNRALMLGTGIMEDAVWFCVPCGRNRFDGDRQAVIFASSREAQEYLRLAQEAGRIVWPANAR